jgi:hypothetical protein
MPMPELDPAALQWLVDRIDELGAGLTALKTDLMRLQPVSHSAGDRLRRVSPRHLRSRFVTTGDPKITRLIYDLPETWWSRFYEYAWAAEFVRETDIVLDVACGMAIRSNSSLPIRHGLLTPAIPIQGSPPLKPS